LTTILAYALFDQNLEIQGFDLSQEKNMKTHKCKIMGVIPARYESSRFPGKPLADICGKPMIYWVARRVSQCKMLDTFCVATDDRRIYDTCAGFGYPVMMTKTTHVNGTERVAEIADRTDGDIYINIQGDEPLIDPESIDQMCRQFLATENAEFLQAGTEVTNPEDLHDITVVKMSVGKNGKVLYLSRACIPYPRIANAYKPIKCLGLYGFSRQFLMDFVAMGESPLERAEGIEQLRALENDHQIIYVSVKDEGRSVDTPEDIKRVVSDYADCFETP
jgi:3-deoxy-manno-octulosonate cytidylyltransferase (CMP-KDO synthetase)